MGRRADSDSLAGYTLGVYNLHMLFRKQDPWLDGIDGRFYWQEFLARIKGRVAMVYGYNNDVPLTTSVGVYAALSPNNSEDSALKDMIVAITTYRVDKWHELKVHTYGRNKAKAKRILDGEDPDTVLTGPKTNAFYHNILDPTDPRYVTVDGHMVNIWNNKRQPLDYAGITRKEYELISAGIKEASHRYDLVPCQLQSILWLTWRRLNRILYDPQMKLELDENNPD